MSDPLQALVSAVEEVPAVVRSTCLDVLASNPLARRLSAAFEPGVNMARFTFLNPVVRGAVGSWPQVAAAVARTLRAQVADHLDDPVFRNLVGELAARSDDFNHAWSRAADPSQPPAGSGSVRLAHPVVGELSLTWTDLVAPAGGRDVLTLWRPDDPLSAQRLRALRPPTTPTPGRDGPS